MCGKITCFRGSVAKKMATFVRREALKIRGTLWWFTLAPLNKLFLFLKGGNAAPWSWHTLARWQQVYGLSQKNRQNICSSSTYLHLTINIGKASRGGFFKGKELLPMKSLNKCSLLLRHWKFLSWIGKLNFSVNKESNFLEAFDVVYAKVWIRIVAFPAAIYVCSHSLNEKKKVFNLRHCTWKEINPVCHKTALVTSLTHVSAKVSHAAAFHVKWHGKNMCLHKTNFNNFAPVPGWGKSCNPFPAGRVMIELMMMKNGLGGGGGGKLPVGNTARKPGAQCLIYVLFYFQSRGFSPYCARCLRDIRVRCWVLFYFWLLFFTIKPSNSWRFEL